MSPSIYNAIIFPWLILGILVFLTLLFTTAPYGKFSNRNWGPTMSFKFGWFIQEIISPIFFSYFFLTGIIEVKSIAWFFFILWNLHYFNRSIIFPLRKKGDSYCPILVVLMAIFFNMINGFINGYYLGNMFQYDNEYIYSLKFIFGLCLFLIGVIINLKSDNMLLKLKSKGTGYKIPRGFMFEKISCPNYFGEIIEWLGFAIMTWSMPGFLFFLWTSFNLIPRAVSQHKWYKNKFDNYPKKRKAIIPYIW